MNTFFRRLYNGYINTLHWFYWLYCRFTYKERQLLSLRYKELNFFLRKHHYVLLEDFIQVDDANQVCNAYRVKKIEQRNNNICPPFYSGKRTRNLSLCSYPKEYLDQVSYLYFPIRTMPVLIKFLEKNLGDFLRSYFKCEYSIQNVWIYETMNIDNTETYNLNSKWHTDGFPYGYLKIIIYLSDVDTLNGPFCVFDPVSKKKIEMIGKPGNVIAFNNKLLHCGKNTWNNNRYACSFLLMPSPQKVELSTYEDKPLDFNYFINPFNQSLND